MKNDVIYYSTKEIANLLDIEFQNILYRSKKLGLKPCFEVKSKYNLGFVKYWSIDKLNLISKMGKKVSNYVFIVSNFENVKPNFIEFQSKINENGFN